MKKNHDPIGEFLKNFQKNGEKDTPFFPKIAKIVKKGGKKRSEKLKSQKLLKKREC